MQVAKTASPAPAAGSHIDALDGLRGAAILLVLLMHTVCFPASTRLERYYHTISGLGWAGVDLFFVLSGFLITGILIDARGAKRYFRNFYARRVLRIFPLYYAFLFAVCFLTPRFPSLHVGGPLYKTYLGYFLLYLTNIVQAFQIKFFLIYRMDVLPFWSLAVEEQFYLFWPLLVWACRRKALLRVCVVLIATAFLLRTVLLLRGLSPAPLYLLTPMRIDTLAAGALVALLVRSPLDRKRLARWGRVAVGAFALLLVAVFVRAKSVTPWTPLVQTVGYSALAGFFASLLLVLVVAPAGILAAAFRWCVLRGLGRYSYAMYIFHGALLLCFGGWFAAHGPVLAIGKSLLAAQFVFTAFILVCSLGLALVSWHCLEKHFLRLKRFFPLVPLASGQGGTREEPLRRAA